MPEHPASGHSREDKNLIYLLDHLDYLNSDWTQIGFSSWSICALHDVVFIKLKLPPLSAIKASVLESGESVNICSTQSDRMYQFLMIQSEERFLCALQLWASVCERHTPRLSNPLLDGEISYKVIPFTSYAESNPDYNSSLALFVARVPYAGPRTIRIRFDGLIFPFVRMFIALQYRPVPSSHEGVALPTSIGDCHFAVLKHEPAAPFFGTRDSHSLEPRACWRRGRWVAQTSLGIQTHRTTSHDQKHSLLSVESGVEAEQQKDSENTSMKEPNEWSRLREEVSRLRAANLLLIQEKNARELAQAAEQRKTSALEKEKAERTSLLNEDLRMYQRMKNEAEEKVQALEKERAQQRLQITELREANANLQEKSDILKECTNQARDILLMSLNILGHSGYEAIRKAGVGTTARPEQNYVYKCSRVEEGRQFDSVFTQRARTANGGTEEDSARLFYTNKSTIQNPRGTVVHRNEVERSATQATTSADNERQNKRKEPSS